MRRKKGYYDQLESLAESLRKKGVADASVAVFSGTTIKPLLSCLNESVSLAFESFKGALPVSSAALPPGWLRFGTLKNTDIPVLAVEGQLPLGQGFSAAEAACLVRLTGLLGVRTAILVSSGIGLNPDFAGGDLMLVEDHINITGADPLRGINDERIGPNVLDMTAAYQPELLGTAEELSIELRIAAHRGIVLSAAGPTFPTRAEYRLYRNHGADAVESSSMALEAAAARGMNMDVLGLVVLVEVEHLDYLGPVTVEQIMSVENTRQDQVGRLIDTVIRRMN